MDAQRAKDILRHITKDEDNGVEAMRKLSSADVINVINKVLPACISHAKETNRLSDEEYFTHVRKLAYLVAVEKLKKDEKRWVVYDEETGYPYIVGDDMIILYDYAGKDKVLKPLMDNGYKVSLLAEDEEAFTNEVAHMYRNGYKYIRYVDGKGEPLFVAREDLYPYNSFFKDDYVTNPGLQAALIRNIQENARQGAAGKNPEYLKKLRYELNVQYQNAEFMVPCAKIETEDEIQFAHPPIDITKDFPDAAREGKQVIAIPVFTDGFELEKCYTGQHETMLYNIKQLRDLLTELGVDGFVLNYLGQKCFLDREFLKVLSEETAE